MRARTLIPSVMVRLFTALRDCRELTQSLQSLDLSHNTMGPEGTNAFAAWMTDCLPYGFGPLFTVETTWSPSRSLERTWRGPSCSPSCSAAS